MSESREVPCPTGSRQPAIQDGLRQNLTRPLLKSDQEGEADSIGHFLRIHDAAESR
jgi:hypothetical protein